MNKSNSAEELLEQIFSIAEKLYSELCHKTDDPLNDHSVIFDLLTDFGKTLINADRTSFWKWDKHNHEIWTAAAVGTEKITIPEGTGIVGKALMEGRTVIVNDPYNNPDFNSEVDKKTGYVTRSILVMPVANCHGEFIGAYQAINKLDGDGMFNNTEDVKKLSLAAFVCGIALESDIFLDDAHHDRLTGLKNRMGFYNDYNKKFAKLLSDTSNVHEASLFICDIDFFKKVNDTYGHNAGDAVLKHVADILRENTGSCDGLYRWGGEEFIVIMPDTDPETAVKAAERIRTSVMQSECRFEDMSIKVTMSFGVTKINGKRSIEGNIKDADEKLYKAKESGRNKVIS